MAQRVVSAPLGEASARSAFLKSLAVIDGRDLEHAVERPPKRLDRAEATVTGHLLQLISRFLESTARSFDAHPLDEFAWRGSRIAMKDPRKVPWVHSSLGRQRFDAQVALQIVEDPRTEIRDLLAIGGLQGQRGTELGLATGAVQIEHHFTRHRERQRGAEVRLDERQGEVHTGRHPGCRVRIAVADINGIGVDRRVREAFGQLARPLPVRRGPFTVEQACCTEEECSGTDRSDAAHSRRDRAEPLDEVSIVLLLADVGPASDEERVDRSLEIAKRHAAGESETTVRRDGRAARGAGEYDTVWRRAFRVCSHIELGRARKNLEGTGDIEDLATGRAEQDDRFGASRGGSLSRGRVHGSG